MFKHTLLRYVSTASLLMASPFAGGISAVLCEGNNGQCDVAGHEAAEASAPVLKGDLDARIEDYLMSHPEVVEKAHEKYMREAREKAAEVRRVALGAAQADLRSNPNDGVIGNPDGDITLVEFFDDQCPYCHSLEPTIEALIKANPNLRVVLKEFVLSRDGTGPILGAGSLVAAKAALAAKRQGREPYARFHHGLMADKTKEGELALPRILEIAAAAGLDLKRLADDMNDPKIADYITETQGLARRIGVTGTPGLVLDAALVTERDLPSLQAAIDRIRKDGTAAPKT